MTNIYSKSMWVTTAYLLGSIVMAYHTYLTQVSGTINFWVHAMPILTAIVILAADVYILKRINLIRQKRQIFNYLLLSSLCVIVFQVIFDFLYLNPVVNWHMIVYDIMFNISFCVLFIVTFKFADIFWFDLADSIDMEK